jgi:hypothetical protein
MSKALKLGVMFAKAVGNYGAGGLYEADANIAAGSVVVGSIDKPVSTGVVRASAFSAYGPVGNSCGSLPAAVAETEDVTVCCSRLACDVVQQLAAAASSSAKNGVAK